LEAASQVHAQKAEADRAVADAQQEMKSLQKQLISSFDRHKELQAQLASSSQQESRIKMELDRLKSHVQSECDSDRFAKTKSDHAFSRVQASCKCAIAAASSCEYFALQIGISYGESAQYRLNGCVKDIENWGDFFVRRQVLFTTHVVCSDQNTSIGATQKLGGCRDDIVCWDEARFGRNGPKRRSSKSSCFLISAGTARRCAMMTEMKRMVSTKQFVRVISKLPGVIVDDDLCRWLETLPPHQLFAVCDCCHSGTCLDLGEFSGFFGSGCRDDQVSADATSSGNASGAFTACFIARVVLWRLQPV